MKSKVMMANALYTQLELFANTTYTAAIVKATAAQSVYVCNVNAARDMTHTASAN